jgi:uncharacterized protein (DUF305 family)
MTGLAEYVYPSGVFIRPLCVLIALLSVSAVACGGTRQTRPPIVQPGAPGEASRVVTPDKAADVSRVGHTAADTRFMQGMIAHHAQAVEMTELLSTRTSSDAMRKLAGRIQASQTDEIKMMERWLSSHGEEVPSAHAHHMMGTTLMPGMLTQEELDRLAAVRGSEFDRLFLEGMIKHHEGALVMVKELFATPGAGQDSDIFAFASDVDADQRMEIDRMRGMLKEFEK